MYVSLKWLSQYVNLQELSPEEIAEKITRSGIEVEGVHHLSEGLKKLMVGEIKEKVKHPDSDHLNICQVDFGEIELSQIVCGAPNVEEGQKIVAVRPNGYVGGKKIKKGKLRGEVSNGMICSLQELGMDSKVVPKKYADGIFVLPEDTPVGMDAIEALSLDDVVLELGLTPNRSDAMSMLGVAYEVAAILSEEINLPEPTYTASNEKASDVLKVSVEAKEQNPMYTAKVVKNVKVGESPLWLQERLMAAGVRPLNNVVDITNYVLMEYGQPLHAFDYDALGTGEILVRLANDGEKITTLDGQERELTKENLVITNGKEAVAVAGVMGGLDSEVTDTTTTVVIESAYFEGQSIRQTAKSLGLRSEASARYEKGIDPNRVIPAAERAAQLLAELAGGEVLEGTVMVDELEKEPTRVVVSPDFVNARLGMKISLNEMVSILKRLKFTVETANGLLFIDVPTRRQDVKIEEDVVEEIARLYGYDEIPATLPVDEGKSGGLTHYQAKRRIVHHLMQGIGLEQALTYSLTSYDLSQKYAIETAQTTRLLMPMSEERSTLRQSILPHLIEAVTYNVSRQQDTVALYEIGSVFLGQTEEGLPHEEEHIAIALTGDWLNHKWQGENKKVDFFVLKGILEAMFAKLDIEGRISLETAVIDGMHPGRTAKVLLDNKSIGFLGQIHPSEQKAQGIKETYVAELNIEALLNTIIEPLKYVPVPRFPSVSRDIALVVNSAVKAGDLEEIIRRAGGDLLKDIHVFDLYEGDKMEAGKKSLAFTLTYQTPERTLTDEEVVGAHDQVLKELTEAGAEIR